MAENFTVTPASGSKIIRNQVFSMLIEYAAAGDKAKEIGFESNLGLKLMKAIAPKKLRGNWVHEYMWRVDATTAAPSLKIIASDSSIQDKIVNYMAVAGPEMKPESCILRSDLVYLFDPSPLDFYGTDAPKDTNPFIVASMNPTAIDGTVISDIDIQLCVSQPLRLFTPDKVEIPCFYADEGNDEYWFLLEKDSPEALVLNIYATKGVSSLVSLGTSFDNTEYNQNHMVFINTSEINKSPSFDRAQIQETALSSSLIRPDLSDYFHFLVPRYESARVGDFIIGFNTDDKADPYKKQVCYGQVSLSMNEYYTFKADYTELYEGDNYISFVALSQGGNASGSELNYVNYNSGGNNDPDPDDVSRTLVAPIVKDQYGRIVGRYQAININSIGENGISVWLPSDSKGRDHTVAEGDVITIKAYISYCKDINTQPRPLPVIIASNYTLKATDIKDGYYTIGVSPSLLLGYEVTSRILSGSITFEYSRLAQGQKSKLLIRSFDTVAPYL